MTSDGLPRTGVAQFVVDQPSIVFTGLGERAIAQAACQKRAS
jgi:hypothetical protein